MGNSNSNGAGKHPIRKDTGDVLPMHQSGGANSMFPARDASSISPDKLRHSLREKGLVVAESDMREVLTKQMTTVNALAFLIESGKARRSVKPQRGSSVMLNATVNDKVNQEQQLKAASHTSIITPLVQKRGRQDGSSAMDANEMDTGEATPPVNLREPALPGDERPPKRVTLMMAPSSGPDDASERSPAPASNTPPRLETHKTSPQAQVRAADSKGEARLPGSRVLVPLQPSVVPTRAVSPEAVSTIASVPQCPSAATSNGGSKPQEVGRRSFDNFPRQFKRGQLDRMISSVVGLWSQMGADAKAEAVRAVERDLYLPPLASERLERVRRDLAAWAEGTLGDLAKLAVGQQEGIIILNELVWTARRVIHDNCIAVAGSYAQLYPEAKKAACLEAVAENAPSISASLYSPGSPEGLSLVDSSPTAQGSCPSSHVTPAGASNGSSALHPRVFRFGTPGPRSKNASWTGSPASIFSPPSMTLRTPFGSASFTSRLGLQGPSTPGSSERVGTEELARKQGRLSETVGGASSFPQDDAFWASLSVCKAAQSRAMTARKEGEWLQQQASKVKGRARDVAARSEEGVREGELEVKKLEEEICRASEEAELLTKEVLKVYLDSDGSKEASLRALLSSIQKGSQGEEQAKLKKRQRVIETLEALTSTRERRSARLVVLKRAHEMVAVLCRELYGDVVDIVEDLAKEANKRRLSHQADLKITAQDALEKMHVAVSFHLRRKSKAQDKVERGLEEQKEERLLFGDTYAAKSSKAQAHIDEMRGFAQDSAVKMRAMKEAAEHLHSKLQVELPLEDLEPLVEATRRFFKSNENLAAAQAGGSKPGGHSQGEGTMMPMDDGDPCNLM